MIWRQNLNIFSYFIAWIWAVVSSDFCKEEEGAEIQAMSL